VRPEGAKIFQGFSRAEFEAVRFRSPRETACLMRSPKIRKTLARPTGPRDAIGASLSRDLVTGLADNAATSARPASAPHPIAISSIAGLARDGQRIGVPVHRRSLRHHREPPALGADLPSPPGSRRRCLCGNRQHPTRCTRRVPTTSVRVKMRGHASKLARAFAIVPVSRPGVNPGATL
jgi:hypothetical protein